MKKSTLFFFAASIILSALLLVGCAGCAHTHDFSLEVTDERYEKTAATCETEGIYYKSCACGERGEETFTSPPVPCAYGAPISGGGSHTRVCAFNPSHTVSERCTGGTATCSALALCSGCGGSYGEPLPCRYEGGVCTVCEYPVPSQGLFFRLSTDGYVELAGLGECTDTEIVVPAFYNGLPVSAVAIGAFKNTAITSIVLPDSVSVIGEEAFCEATSLRSVRAGEGLLVIGKSAFASCELLESFSFGSALREIGALAFYNCASLPSFLLSNDIQTVGDSAFFGASALSFNRSLGGRYLGSAENPYLYLYRVEDLYQTSYEINPDCRIIGTGAFKNCKEVVRIVIPDSVRAIGSEAFYACSKLDEVVVGNGCRVIGECAFSECRYLGTVTLGASVSRIEAQAFENCERLLHISLSEALTFVDRSAFSHCYNLNYNKNGSGHKYLGNGENPYIMLVGVDAASVRMTEEVEEGCRVIATNAFMDLPSLHTVILPASLQGISAGAFSRCSSLSEVCFTGTADDWAEIEFHCNPIAIKNGSGDHPVLSFNGEVAKDITISRATAIKDNAFAYCETLRRVTVGASVERIGSYAFRSSGVTALVVEGACEIGEGAFYACESLESVTLGEGTESIGASAFEGCTTLAEISVPSSVRAVGINALHGCTALKNATLGAGVRALPSRIFEDCSSLETVTLLGVLRTVGLSPFDFSNATLKIHFVGTVAEWQALDCSIPYLATVKCIDGDITP